jgi:hypothetical protein
MSSPVAGIDPDFLKQLQAIMGQMGPSEADTTAARKMALSQFGAAALANVRKPTLMGLGEAAGTGLLGYNNELTRLGQQRQQSVQSAAQIMPLLNAAAYRQYATGGGSGTPGAAQGATPPPLPPQQGVAPSTAAQFGPQNGQPTGLMGMAPAPQQAPPPLPAPPAASPGSPGSLIEQADALNIPRAATISALYSNDPAGKMGALFEKYGTPINVRQGGSVYVPGKGPVFYSPKVGENINMVDGKATPVEGAFPLAAANAAIPLAAKAAYEPQPTINATGQAGIVPGQTKLGTVGGMPFLDGLVPSPQGAPPVPNQDAQAVAMLKARGNTPSIVDAGPNGLAYRGAPSKFIQTELSPEQTGVSKNLAEQQLNVDNEARAAQNVFARTQEIRALSSMSRTSAAAPFRMAVAKWADAAGLPADTVNGIAGGNLPAMQALGKQAVQGAFEAAKSALGSGQRITQNEILTMAQNSPNVAMTPQAINSMLDFQEGVAKWQTDKQTAKDEWVASKGSYSGFENNWNRNHPLNDYVPSRAQLEAALFPNGTPDKAGAAPVPASSGWSIKRIQ